LLLLLAAYLAWQLRAGRASRPPSLTVGPQP
jgi:hypothetical protein